LSWRKRFFNPFAKERGLYCVKETTQSKSESEIVKDESELRFKQARPI